MRVLPVQSYTTKNAELSKNKYGTMPSFGIGPGTTNYIIEHSAKIHEVKWSQIALKILERNDEELKDLAGQLHKLSDADLRAASVVRKYNKFWGTYGAELPEQTRKAYIRLSEAVKKVVDNKLKMVKEITALETKKISGWENTVEQKERVKRQFISLLRPEQEGNNPPITNGILVYGTSPKKDEFINWLEKSSNAVIKKIEYNPNNPLQTIEQIVKIAENGEITFQTIKARTILIVKGLDEMLTNHGNVEGLKIIGRFKGFIEHMSADYHTTLVTKTEKSLDDFEEASIAPHRFGIQVDLKDGISVEEFNHLKKLQDEVDYLDWQASTGTRSYRY